MTSQHSIAFDLEPVDNARQAMLCGPMDDNLKTIAKRLGVEISYRGSKFKVSGAPNYVTAVVELLKSLYVDTATVKGEVGNITAEDIHLAILSTRVLEQEPTAQDADFDKMITIKTN